MTKQAIVSNKLAPPVGPFSAAVRSNGFIYRRAESFKTARQAAGTSSIGVAL